MMMSDERNVNASWPRGFFWVVGARGESASSQVIMMLWSESNEKDRWGSRGGAMVILNSRSSPCNYYFFSMPTKFWICPSSVIY
jgi:hypothetical protein